MKFMKAKISVNEEMIKQALLAYFKNLGASHVTLNAYQNQGYGSAGSTITGEVTVELGDPIAYRN
ncbi:MAG: hypothetical protein EOO61_07900 [Hymenobacter sp.]|nr:MAG: hypothetical protein EOO61_07900 [Hymenobacter sp.]